MFTTHAHALKSASANIGADEISHMAAELEYAGGNSDTDYIKSNIKHFIDGFSIILDNIKCCLNSYVKDQNPVSKKPDYAFLRDALIKISESFENVDIEAIETVVDELRVYNWEDNLSSLLDKIKDCIGVFDYDGVEDILVKLKQYVTQNNNKV